jgi:hypothetical protein
MTDLEKLRKALMKQIDTIDKGNANTETVNNLVSASNAVIKSYNVELRADELKQDAESQLIKNSVFKES